MTKKRVKTDWNHYETCRRELKRIATDQLSVLALSSTIVDARGCLEWAEAKSFSSLIGLLSEKVRKFIYAFLFKV